MAQSFRHYGGMEASSPLAALQPSCMQDSWALPRSRMTFDSNFLQPNACQQSTFNFKDMSMFRAKQDYFSCKPVRGSSPTASLAVDLSQNFHIDKSPQLPTPRRSLFTSNLLGGEPRKCVVTPPIPSSSPAPITDAMDMSPLPHKPAYAVVHNISMCSPTPEATPDLAETPVPSFETVRPDSQPTLLPSQPQAKKQPTMPRPLLRKTHSTSGILPRHRATQNYSGSFVFGSNSGWASRVPLESFAESPPSVKKPSSEEDSSATISQSMLGDPTLRQQPLFANGSPVGAMRRPSTSRVPRIGLGRRSHSVQYPNPAKAMRAEKRCCTTGSMQPTIDLDDTLSLKLPNFKRDDDPEGLPRITRETLINVLDGCYAHDIGKCAVIDCRFEYEYQGGHIDGALNFNDKEDLARHLFDSNLPGCKAIVFHCEYSAHRAPLMAKFIRQRDRTVNQDAYPRLSYPEIYILDGGYHNFYKEHRARCFPQNYVEMDAKEHENACELGMAKVKRRAKLSRAQTYAFGQFQHDLQGRTALQTTLLSPQNYDIMDVDMVSPLDSRPPRLIKRLDSY